MSENREPAKAGEACYVTGCQAICWRWWPYTPEGARHEGQSMLACEKHFHQVWAGEA